jgi:uptake hydrogenase large subunit
MTRVLATSAIGVDATLSLGRVTEAVISPRRTVDVSLLFKGMEATSVPAVVGSLYTLCAASQRAASEAAVAAALGRQVDEAMHGRWSFALYAERVAEHLRASLLDWPGSEHDAMRRVCAPPVRKALAAARAAAAGAANATSIHAALEKAATELGANVDDVAAPPDSWFGRLWRDAQAAPLAPFPKQSDFLTLADIDAVHHALRVAPPEFLSCPRLPGRIVETGAVARQWERLRRDLGLLAARLQARLFDIAEGLEALRRLAQKEEAKSDLVATRSARPGEALAIVDSPRGFLFHRVEVDDKGRVVAYDLLAPTEWNFHPAGPFALALTSASLNSDDPCTLIGRLAALFDPCASCKIHVYEAVHA